jgi:DNA repair protein RecO (recombination protein O)
MPAEESTAAIVLRARDYSEADRIVTLLTRDFGKLGGIAKGAKASRRRFERKLEPFTQVILYFRRRPLGQLVFITRAERFDGAPAEFDELGRIALGSYMLELTDALTTEEAEATAAYHVLADAIHALARGGAVQALRQSFELKMLEAAGFGLEFGHCRLCGRAAGVESAIIYFVPVRGGLVCGRCRNQAPETGVRLAAADAASLARLGCATLDEAPALPAGGGETSLAITRFLATILDRKLRSVDFLDSIL